MIGLVAASSAAIELARDCTSATALYICLRIMPSRLKDLTMRTPNTVSCRTWMIWAIDRNSSSIMRRGPLQQPVDAEDRGRAEDQGDQRQVGLLDDHHDDQADQRKQVAHEGGDDDVDHRARRLRALGQAHDQVGRRKGMIELDAVLEHAVVDHALPLGDDAVSGAAEEQRLHIGRETLDDEDRSDAERRSGRSC